MVRENQNSLESRSVTRSVEIDLLTESVLGRYAEQIESKKIRVDTELQRLTADVFPRFIDSAVCTLIENAIEATPTGGELNITLIDGESCWELEVADSAVEKTADTTASSTTREKFVFAASSEATQRARYELVRRAASLHGGQIQTWNCPQGGTANVLVIPRRQETNKSA